MQTKWGTEQERLNFRAFCYVELVARIFVACNEYGWLVGFQDSVHTSIPMLTKSCTS